MTVINLPPWTSRYTFGGWQKWLVEIFLMANNGSWDLYINKYDNANAFELNQYWETGSFVRITEIDENSNKVVLDLVLKYSSQCQQISLH